MSTGQRSVLASKQVTQPAGRTSSLREADDRATAGWVSVGVISRSIRALNRGYVALPRSSVRHWWRTIGAGVAVILTLTALLVWVTRGLDQAGMLAWEAGALLWLVEQVPISFSTAMWLEGLGNGFVLWFVVLYAAAVSARAGDPLQSLAFLLGHTLAYLPIAFGWLIWNRPRPQLIMDGVALPGGVFHAFPSGHMVQSAFAIGLILWLWLRAANSRGERLFASTIYLIVIVTIGFGRLRIGVHWPTDIVAGVVIGATWAAVVVRAVHPSRAEIRAGKRPASRMSPERNHHAERIIS